MQGEFLFLSPLLLLLFTDCSASSSRAEVTDVGWGIGQVNSGTAVVMGKDSSEETPYDPRTKEKLCCKQDAQDEAAPKSGKSCPAQGPSRVDI